MSAEPAMDGTFIRPRERELLLAVAARDRYDFRQPLIVMRGEEAVGDLHAARVLARKMNERRDAARNPALAVRAGHLASMGLLLEIMRAVIRRHRREKDPGGFNDALDNLRAQHGGVTIDAALLDTVRLFPPAAVYRDGLHPGNLLEGAENGVPRRELVLEEMLLLTLANRNRAFGTCRELVDDAPLAAGRIYPGIFEFLRAHFAGRPAAGSGGRSLPEVLLEPLLASPDSLEGQLGFILRHWGHLVPSFLLTPILTVLDITREETRPAFTGFVGPPPPPPDEAAFAASLDRDEERYTPDRGWMGRLVLMAKSVYVWLHQLSLAYGRPIDRLDQIPDEELDRLAAHGFSGLWLIGVWERSTVSRDIKRRSGNPEAEASAYSLFDYTVADDLGGEGALVDLRRRAIARGIRLAADMVPNHTGIYSRWIIEHPEWFVQLSEPPFPGYRFDGPDLSPDSRIGLYLEDGYWSRTDAAVVFKRIDRSTGETRYIYHGNDGTGLPWNDTAQLDYLQPEVRKAVLGTVMHVAGLFPVVRFDAAMTLTRRHYRRLWFPAPGTGGDIPSRAGHGLSADEFDRRFPVEFWREVVDRCSAENPETLLLAEAFWLMEGYFVRTLGMHRVYNSAFMNMLKRESNAEYRQTLKNVLAYDPEILKRFVNFMNNPDEDTAVAQFGKGDKYFGTAVMLATLPGLPMFGHGQVEGLTEKYGMEYRRAYHDEQTDEDLVRRHEREVFPLLHRRRLFAEAERFTLYDAWRGDGTVDENVYAYSNCHEGEASLVVFHNTYASTSCWVRESTPVIERDGEGRRLVNRTLGTEMGLTNQPRRYCRFRDVVGGLEYLRPSAELLEKGLHLVLGAYDRHVFLDIREFEDTDGRWEELYRFLGGRGTPSLDATMRQLLLTPLHRAYADLTGPAMVSELAAASGMADDDPAREAAVERWARAFDPVLRLGLTETGGPASTAVIRRRGVRDVRAALALVGKALGPERDEPGAREAAYPGWRILVAVLGTWRLGELWDGAPDPERSASAFEEWLLHEEIAAGLRRWGEDEKSTAAEVTLLRVLLGQQEWMFRASSKLEPVGEAVKRLLDDPDAQNWLAVNAYENVLWFSKERWEELVAWLSILGTILAATDLSKDRAARERAAEEIRMLAMRLDEAATVAGYRVDVMLRLLNA